MIDFSDVESVIEECFNEMTSASRSKYDSEKAERTAALFLTAQMKLSMLIEEIEIQAKGSKNDIARIEGQKYFEIKSSGDKHTENSIAAKVAKDTDVITAKLDCAKSEASLKKYGYIMNVLKDSTYFFRNLGKSKSWAE